ncbi:MAG: QueT transporter family protein [Clostridiales Family XIII bacterium]|jgi:uncharacterized membrane protein|nr:QueT transporter family protein [Clostridiales Family XIII bacterium]
MQEFTDKNAVLIGRVRFMAQAAVIGAAYAALTLVLAPLSYGVMQLRVSEALTILPYFTPAAIPGLFIGCLTANIISPYGIVDMICGSLATLFAACATYAFRKRRILAPLFPVVFNAVIIGAMLYYAYGVNASLLLNILWVGAGELIVCYGAGYPLLRVLENRREIFK